MPFLIRDPTEEGIQKIAMKHTSTLVLATLLSGLSCGSGGGSNVTVPYVSQMVVNALPAATKSTSIHPKVSTRPAGARSQTQAQADLDNVMRVLWNQKKGDPCSTAEISAGTCFASATGTQFYKPSPLLHTCDRAMPPLDAFQFMDNSALQKACELDSTVDLARSSIDQCSGSQGAHFDIGYFVPWYASWGIPQTDASMAPPAPTQAMPWRTTSGTGSRPRPISDLPSSICNRRIA